MIWLISILFPMLAAFLLLGQKTRGLAFHLMLPVAAAPALFAAIFADPSHSATFPSLLLTSSFGLDSIGQVFLFFTALLWAVAACYARSYMADDRQRWSFSFFFLATMSGNLGLIAAEDIVSFYFLFALMTYAAYGLIIHSRDAESFRAGRVYIAMAVMGELLLLAAIFLAVNETESLLLSELPAAVANSDRRNLILLFAFAGFGVKAGAVPLYFWLPLAHPVAPTPASAVLSGAMIKAGLLGWLRFFSGGDGHETWSHVLIVLGFLAAFGAAAIGTAQKAPKTILAYSSISQMGLLTVALGIGVGTPEAWAAALPAILVFSLHHGLAKGALFLGSGVASEMSRNRWSGRLVWTGLAFAAFSIAGGPFSGGATAKHALKDAAYHSLGNWSAWMHWLLPLSSAATALVLARFLQVSWRQMQKPAASARAGLWMPWASLILGYIVLIPVAIEYYAIEAAPFPPVELLDSWSAFWPVALGAGLLVCLVIVVRKTAVSANIPAGDFLVWIEAAAQWMRSRWKALTFADPANWQIDLVRWVDRFFAFEARYGFAIRAEKKLAVWAVTGSSFILIAVLALLLLTL